MAGNTLVLQRQPGVHWAPSAPIGGGSERAVGAPLRHDPSLDTPSETDAHLRRSYALVERLRREVAARAAGIA